LPLLYHYSDFIHGPLVRGVCDDNEDFINKIVHWLENHVLVHEDMFLHFRRRGVRTLGVAHSSGHEGTNFGIKAHSASIKATMGMDKSAEALSLQSAIKTGELDEMARHDYNARNKKWSNLPSSPDTCRHAEGLLTVVMLRRDLYVARRVGEREFEVEYIGDAVFLKDYLDCGIFPLFWRCRRVTVTDDGKLVCSCKAFEEDGILCPLGNKCTQ